MAIKKKVDKNAESFISKGGSVKNDKGFQKPVSVLIKFPKDLIDRVNDAINLTPWKSRTSWIIDAVFEKLEREKNDN